MYETQERINSIIVVAAPYWAGEAEVVRTYFSRPRSQAQDLFWLRAQAYKEARPFRDLPKDLQVEFLRTGATRDNPHTAETAQRIIEETRHFWLLADLIANLFGVTVSLTDTMALPEDRTLQELRAAFKVQGGELERAAVVFTEGGGGAMFHVLSCLDGGKLEQEIASVFKIIAAEEVPHGAMEIHAVARCAKSEADWERVRMIVHTISRQRLLMRNEMFGFPLSVARLQEVDAGQIQPWSVSVAL
ncbi:MAG: hypothetical protein AB7P69_26430 [Candidatus Binatia bacterium]